eukprot:Sdes_comp23112_c0_seq1m21427
MSEPDSWEDTAAQEVTASIPKLSLNPTASSFVPNFAAKEFVPSFAKASPVSPPVPTQIEAPHVPEPEIVEFGEDFIDPLDSIPSGDNHIIPNQDSREHLNIIFIGHVDAGKSTIGGHIMYLTGQVDQRTLEKNMREAKEKNRETWYLSWALDTNAEERDKGKTVECGLSHFDTEKKRFTILDAPGHKSYVPNMISGAAQADIAVLVISARKGEYETGFERGGQTREHAMLAKTAGVKFLIVAINKMDDPTVEWSKDRYEECVNGIGAYLKKCGYNLKKDVYFLPISGQTGSNLKDRLDPKVCNFYSGPSLLEYLDALPKFERMGQNDPLRIPIVDKYSDMGVVILGKLESGACKVGDKAVVMPNSKTVMIVSIIRDEEEVSYAVSGDNVKIKLKGIEEDEIMPGFIVCDTRNFCHSTKVFDAKVVIVEHKSIIAPGYTAVMHIHTCAEEVSLVKFICMVDKKTGEKKRSKNFVKQDEVCIARFECQGAVCMEKFKDYPQLGRFTLRDEGKTVAIGRVLKLIDSGSEA